MRFVLAITFLAASAFAHAQHADKYAGFLSELGKNMGPKSMEKTWKKRGAAWDAEVLKAADAETLVDLAIEFEGLVDDKVKTDQWSKRKMGWRGDMSGTKTLANFGIYLVELEEGIAEEGKLDAWKERREAWTIEITDLSAQVVKESQAITVNEQEFAGPFNRIWEDAKVGYPNITVGDGEKVEGVGEAYKTTIKLPRAKQCQIIKIQEDDSYVLTYVGLYHCGNFEDNAKDLFTTLSGYIDKNLPDNFPGKNNYGAAYLNQTNRLWELKSDNFTDITRNPFAQLGIIKKDGSYYVELRVAEPIFKR